MSTSDAFKWNERYESGAEAAFEEPREFLVAQAAHLPKRGVALDLAMGLGGNAGLLIERGLHVIGVDISEVGVQRAKRRWPQLEAAVIDLETYSWPVGDFDVILNFYYCQRSLWPCFRSLLKPGGVLIFQTLLHDARHRQPDVNPDFLLQPSELRQAFAAWDVVVYWEGLIEVTSHAPRAVASMVARRPA